MALTGVLQEEGAACAQAEVKHAGCLPRGASAEGARKQGPTVTREPEAALCWNAGFEQGRELSHIFEKDHSGCPLESGLKGKDDRSARQRP